MSAFWFLSFANSALDGLIRSPLKRIRRQAEAMGVFEDRIRVWTENDLDEDFRVKMKDRLIPGSRGYGYWCWKPQIVLQLLREMKDGDVLLYADAGCHLNPRGIPRLMDYFNLAREHGIVAFQARSMDGSRKDDLTQHFLPDGEWCKGDLLDNFGVRDNAAVVNTGQLGGTAFLVRRDAGAERFFMEFRQVFYDRFELCDDSPSKSPNLPGFVENRHDQSVLSIFGKTAGVFSLSCAEYALVNEYSPKTEKGRRDIWPKTWGDLTDFPIWTRHDKGGVRSLFPCWFKTAVHWVTRGRI
jgi:hypothetical protein